MGQKIAIIGGGIAGLTAGYLLNEKHDVTLFERDGRLGGNCQTLKTTDGDVIDVSIFFFNRKTYKNFFRLLDRLGLVINTRLGAGTSMTMKNLDTNKEQYFDFDPVNTFNLDRYSMGMMRSSYGLLKFMRKGYKLYEQGRFEGLTMNESMDLLPGFSPNTRRLFLFPLCLMASMLYDELMEAPANHFWGKSYDHFGTVVNAVSWRLLNIRTQEYVDALSAPFKDKVVLNSDVKSVVRTNDQVTLKMGDGGEQAFDKVIFACWADAALKLLDDPTDEEKKLLGPWRYKDGLMVVHKDSARFPEKKRWAMYGYLYTDANDKINTSINVCYRFERGVSNDCQYLGTQYPNFPIDENLVEFSRVFRTPLYDTDNVPLIAKLPGLNGSNNSYYCGSHFGYGLHEDAVTSAVEVAKLLGARWD